MLHKSIQFYMYFEIRYTNKCETLILNENVQYNDVLASFLYIKNKWISQKLHVL